MKYCLLLLLIIPIASAYPQNELDTKKGFQDITLGSDPREYQSLEFKKSTQDEEVPAIDIYLPKKGFYESVGNIEIHKLTVKAFDNKIYEIEIVAEKDPDFYNGLEVKYGEAKYHLPTNSYIWGGKEVRLSFKSHSKNKVILTYSSLEIKEWIKKKEKENVKGIADDF